MERSSATRALAEHVLCLSGPMNLAECGPARRAIVAAMSRGADLRLDLAGSGPWDLAGLQLVLSAVKTARAEGRTAVLTRVPDGFVQVAKAAGCMEFLDASLSDLDW